MPTILALDPGGTTGWCGVVPGQPPKRGEFSKPAHHDQLWDLLCTYRFKADDHHTVLTIICERFEFRKDDQDRAKIDYSAAHYEGVVELFHAFADKGRHPKSAPVGLVKQGSAQIKSGFWSGDEKLKKVGLWMPRLRHAMDATRHYLHYVTFALNDNQYIHKLR